jgi:hypothetical protein
MGVHHGWNRSIVLIMKVLLDHHEGTLMCHDSVFLLSVSLDVVEDLLLDFVGLVMATVCNFFIYDRCQGDRAIFFLCWEMIIVNVVEVLHA